MAIEQHDVSVAGRHVRYLASGSGAPLLLLHPIGESSASWRDVLAGLAARHTVYAPDLPGFGDSDPLPPGEGGPTPDRLAAAVADFLDAVAGPASSRVVVVGNSLGGTVAIELAQRTRERVAQLVLEDSAALGHYVHPALRALSLPGYGDVATRMGATRVGALQRAWLRVPLLFARPQLAPQHWVDEQLRLATLPHHLPTTLAALRAQVDAFGQRRVLLDVLQRMQIPTLVLWGAQDVVLPVSQARVAARLGAGELVVVPRCGHLPHLERPELFLDALDRFLAR